MIMIMIMIMIIIIIIIHSLLIVQSSMTGSLRRSWACWVGCTRWRTGPGWGRTSCAACPRSCRPSPVQGHLPEHRRVQDPGHRPRRHGREYVTPPPATLRFLVVLAGRVSTIYVDMDRFRKSERIPTSSPVWRCWRSCFAPTPSPCSVTRRTNSSSTTTKVRPSPPPLSRSLVDSLISPYY